MNLELATIENISVLIDCDTKAQGLYAELKFQKDGTVTETRVVVMPTLESLLNYYHDINVESAFEDIKKVVQEIRSLWGSKQLDGFEDLKGHIIVCKMDNTQIKDIDWNPTIDGLKVRSKFDEDANVS